MPMLAVLALPLILAGAPADSTHARIPRLVAILGEYPEDITQANVAEAELSGMRGYAAEIAPLVLDLAEQASYYNSALRALRVVGAFDSLSRPFVPRLMRLADHQDPYVAGEALQVIPMTGYDSPELHALIVRKLKGDIQAAADALKTVAALGPRARDLVPVLVDKLDRDPYYGTRMWAAEALGKIGDGSPRVLESLKRVLFLDLEATGMVEENPSNARYYHNARYAAAHALGALGGGGILLEGIRRLDHGVPADAGDPCSRGLATLGEAGRPYVPDLIELMRSPDERVSAFAVSTLRSLGRVSRPALLDLLGSQDPALEKRIADIIQGMAADSADAVRLRELQSKP